MNQVFYYCAFHVEDIFNDVSWILRLNRDLEEARKGNYRIFLLTFVVNDYDAEFTVEAESAIRKVMKDICFEIRDYKFRPQKYNDGVNWVVFYPIKLDEEQIDKKIYS